MRYGARIGVVAGLDLERRVLDAEPVVQLAAHPGEQVIVSARLRLDQMGLSAVLVVDIAQM